jgi:hypothetical protein
MKLGQQVDGHLAFAPGMRPLWIGRSGQEAFLKAWLTLRDRFYLASHLRKYTRDGVVSNAPIAFVRQRMKSHSSRPGICKILCDAGGSQMR